MTRHEPARIGQFAITPLSLPTDLGWHHVSLDEKYTLNIHPSLHVSTYPSVRGQSTIVGYALDPSRPHLDNQAITQELAAAPTMDSAVSLLNTLTGRFLAVVSSRQGLVLVGDAAGSRQTFYTTEQSDLWAASSAALLAGLLERDHDPEAEAFAQSTDFAQMPGGRWWPGDAARPIGVRRLLPNHLLTVETAQPHRFFPKPSTGKVDYDTALDRLMADLRGSLVAAAQRAPLTLLITAGHDSRLLLAAARPIADEMRFVSITTPTGQTADVNIPRRLLHRVRLSHEHVVATEPSRSFWETYQAQGGPSNWDYAANAEALRPAVANRWAVTGHVSELLKVHYRGARFARRATGRRLSMETGTRGHPYAEAKFDTWLSGIGETYDLHTHDLAYWEGRVGSWLSSWSLEYDTVWDDVLMPFANRRLLETVLRSSEEHRTPPTIRMWEEAIGSWWPELLEEPFGGNDKPKPSPVKRIRRTMTYVKARA